MYVFIAIIFIAELIVAGFIVYWICRADRCVKDLDVKIAACAPDIIDGIKKTRSGLCFVQKSIKNLFKFIRRKKAEFWQRVVNLVVIYMILLILKTKFKRAATFCQYAVFLKDCWDSIPG